MNYKGTAYSEYFLWPQIHLTSQGDVLQSAQSGQAVLWAVSLQIISLLDRYPFNYLVEGDHIDCEGFSGVLLAQEHAQDFPRMTFWTDTVPIWCTLPDLACGHRKLRSGHILSMLLCKQNSVEGLQPTAQPAHSGHFGEHLLGL